MTQCEAWLSNSRPVVSCVEALAGLLPDELLIIMRIIKRNGLVTIGVLAR